ncbi:MAG: hypothetical protein ACYC3P_09415 [Bellilinea sp.]
MEKMTEKNLPARWTRDDWLAAAGLGFFFLLILVLTFLAALCTSQYLTFTAWS